MQASEKKPAKADINKKENINNENNLNLFSIMPYLHYILIDFEA